MESIGALDEYDALVPVNEVERTKGVIILLVLSFMRPSNDHLTCTLLCTNHYQKWGVLHKLYFYNTKKKYIAKLWLRKFTGNCHLNFITPSVNVV